MSEIPIHIRIMAKLGIIKVTQKRLPPEYQVVSTKHRGIRWPGMSKILPIGIIIPLVFAFLPLFDDENTNTNNADLMEEIKRTANAEGKLDWQSEEWDDPQVESKLSQLKMEIDHSSCERMKLMFEENEAWTLRAYVAHTILEKCQ